MSYLNANIWAIGKNDKNLQKKLVEFYDFFLLHEHKRRRFLEAMNQNNMATFSLLVKCTLRKNAFNAHVNR